MRKYDKAMERVTDNQPAQPKKCLVLQGDLDVLMAMAQELASIANVDTTQSERAKRLKQALDNPVQGFQQNTDITTWFESSYSAYVVLNRSIMEAMPLNWQYRFVQLMNEIEETIDTDKLCSDFWVRAKEGNRFVHDPYREYRRQIDIPFKAKQPQGDL